MLLQLKLHHAPKQRKAEHASCPDQSGAGAKVPNQSIRGRHPVRRRYIYRRTRRTGRAPTRTHNLAARLHASGTIFPTARRKIASEFLDLQLLTKMEPEVVALALRRPASALPGRRQRGCRGGREGDTVCRGSKVERFGTFVTSSASVFDQVLSRFSIRKQMSIKRYADC